MYIYIFLCFLNFFVHNCMHLFYKFCDRLLPRRTMRFSRRSSNTLIGSFPLLDPENFYIWQLVGDSLCNKSTSFPISNNNFITPRSSVFCLSFLIKKNQFYKFYYNLYVYRISHGATGLSEDLSIYPKN